MSGKSGTNFANAALETALELKMQLATTTKALRPLSEELVRRLREVMPGDSEVAAPATDERISTMAEQLMLDAVRENATDIHFEPDGETVLVRLRIDGTLRDALELPRTRGEQLLRRFKVLADLDPTPAIKPADGRIRYRLGERVLDLRIACGPSITGEVLAVRILDPAGTRRNLAELGLNDEHRALLNNWLTDVSGMFLVVGPTGSGKTTTLYALLHELKLRERSIVTLEDPVEYTIPGIVQMQVEERRGLTFETGLKEMLRLDPDYILVGEVRDQPSAQTAVMASASGKLLMSTLHSRDAVGAITALRNYDLKDHEIVAAFEVVVAQRLVRRLCPNCRQLEEPTPEEAAWLDSLAQAAVALTWHARGCEHCRGTGYAGRTGIFEVWRLDEEADELILSHADERTLRRAMRACGLWSLLADGLAKVVDGVTSLAEIQTIGGQGRFYHSMEPSEVRRQRHAA
jgi:type II secretory ATPase GspE/PulE/Tfp pilus assembly ATPase PilB-like protein